LNAKKNEFNVSFSTNLLHAVLFSGLSLDFGEMVGRHCGVQRTKERRGSYSVLFSDKLLMKQRTTLHYLSACEQF